MVEKIVDRNGGLKISGRKVVHGQATGQVVACQLRPDLLNPF